MSKYRIIIEKVDFYSNTLLRSQAEISLDNVEEMKKFNDIDALDELYKQLKYKFKQDEQNQPR